VAHDVLDVVLSVPCTVNGGSWMELEEPGQSVGIACRMVALPNCPFAGRQLDGTGGTRTVSWHRVSATTRISEITMKPNSLTQGRIVPLSHLRLLHKGPRKWKVTDRYLSTSA
jgi:hypothetical protein